ncbi:DUF1795 domain-containing protein [Chitinophaga silvatica]|uniref:DUF1795 domain-containing protein n=1 Tax=Chitinophaga silvatica TaxID=2282649 RepID=A0A3E1Y2L3_9BACT|nr:DcrB-related protein [Chitinophaga silvatica]RFS18866.1 DUF1795 domain-containing protein [Chitinophaga silvatica]
MKVQFVLAISCCLLSFTACHNADKSPQALSSSELLERAGKAPGMNAGNGKFTVKTPAGWTKTDTVISRIEYTFMLAPASPGSQFQTNVNIVTQQIKEGFTVDKYMQSTRQEMESFFADFKLLEEGTRTVTGVKAKWMRCQYIHKETGTLLNGQITILVKNNIAYAITMTTLANELDEYTPALDEILDSFEAQ